MDQSIDVVGVAVLAFFFMKVMEGAARDTTDPTLRVNLASQALNEGNTSEAEKQLDKITTSELGGLPPAYRDRVRDIRAAIDASIENPVTVANASAPMNSRDPDAKIRPTRNIHDDINSTRRPNRCSRRSCARGR